MLAKMKHEEVDIYLIRLTDLLTDPFYSHFGLFRMTLFQVSSLL